MTWPHPGARWWKFDFHTHTPASKDTIAWQRAVGTPDEITPEKWLLKFMAAAMDCVVIADHNSGAWIAPLKNAYAGMCENPPEGFREIHLFPGVEISVSNGLHLLAIFDKEADSDTITGLLGGLGFPDHLKGETNSTDEAACTRESLVKAVEEVGRRGGIAVPAHSDAEKGLLRIQGDGQRAMYPDEIRSVLQSDLLAVEVVDKNARKPDVYQHRSPNWTQVIGSDCHTFQGQNVPGSRFTWVKMATPSLEGLRLALLDGEGVSVLRSDAGPFDPFRRPEHFIDSIEIDQARYMGRNEPARLQFSPFFNALVGGRGTGKSTVVHALRLAYRREEELSRLDVRSEPRQTFERFNPARERGNEGALLDKSEVRVQLSRDGVSHLLRWRQDGNGVVVQDNDGGGWVNSGSQQVSTQRFPLRMFSQGQIAALAGENQEALLGVIDEAAGTSVAIQEMDEARSSFLSLRAQARELEGKLKAREGLALQLSDVQRKIDRFEEAHHAEVLRTYQLRTRQEKEIESHIESARIKAQGLMDSLSSLVVEDPPEELFDASDTIDASAVDIIQRLSVAVETARQTVARAAEDMQGAVERELEAMRDAPWQNAVDNAKAEYDRLVEALGEQGVEDPSEYGKLVQERSRLESEIGKLDLLQGRRDDFAGQASGQLETVLVARQRVSEQRREFLAQTLVDNPFVRIQLLPYGRNPQVIECSLRKELGGTDKYVDDIYVSADGGQVSKGIVGDLLGGLPKDIGEATREFETRLKSMQMRLAVACIGRPIFGGWFNKFLVGEAEKRPEFIDRLLTWFPEDSLQVEYSRRGDGRDYQPITQASAGQRAAAMLAFLLAYGDEPLVLDQPEDDLDNHLIYDLVVRQIRENKLRRQIIVVTHNPNIVVNGDAEMLHALDFRGQCFVKQSGSLQEKEMREEVCRVMEGGREAFERRYKRLGREV